MSIELPVVAGGVSTVLFAASTLPMLIKAGRTKDLRSYSLGNIVLSNVGNVVHSIYVFDLPAGPIWVLHTFYLTTTALMLAWYLRYAIGRRSQRSPSNGAGSVDGAGAVAGGSGAPSPDSVRSRRRTAAQARPPHAVRCDESMPRPASA